MTRWLIREGRVVDPESGRDAVADLLIEDGIVARIGSGLEAQGAEVVDARGCVVGPGLVDLHTHLREPGREDEETILTASRAGAAGGFTALCAMPNTDPVADSAAVVEKVWALGREAGLLQVVPAGALSRGLEGKEMAGIGEMASSPANVRLFTDDGRGVQSALFARRAMEYIVSFGGTYAEHCEDESLAAGGQMNESELSHALGLRGIPAEAEELMAARDVALAKRTGCRLHLLHVSTAGTVEIVRRAKDDGVAVTAEATPHHFSLTEEAVSSYDPIFKVNPPLRSKADREAIIEGLRDGTIDAIATDHAPHATEEKEMEFEHAPCGMLGLETALAVTVIHLVRPQRMSLLRALELLSTRPARILGLSEHGGIAEGRPANLVVFDPEATFTVDRDRLSSKSKNTPFHGEELQGVVTHTFFEGRQTYCAARSEALT
ncbi:MAG TPA: dihydroorotase [Actinomycetota bacterium]|nr:dihydroorotase [Actinomycetota bacterium]